MSMVKLLSLSYGMQYCICEAIFGKENEYKIFRQQIQ